MRASAFRSIAAAIAVGTVIFGGPAVAADEPESYAVVSLIGDEISIVTYQPAVGSSLDSNDRRHVPNADDRFDRVATQVSVGAIRSAVPTATIQGVSIPDRSVLGGPETSLPGEGLPALLDAVTARLAQKDTHYLLLVSRYQGEARLRVRNGMIGSGRLDGLGFYIDATKRMTQVSSSESGRGFVAPFAYLKVSLIDLRTGLVVRSETSTESMTHANTGPSTTLNPWDALTPDQKVRALEIVIRKALLWAVPRVVVPA